MKVKMSRNKNAGVEKFYQEFYEKHKADSIVAEGKPQPKRNSPTSISMLSSKNFSPVRPEVSNPLLQGQQI